jgi:predicted NodU family carbamoyl transferase
VEPLSSLYWEPGYASEEIKQVLDNCKSRYRWFVSDKQNTDETMRLLEPGKIVAWR